MAKLETSLAEHCLPLLLRRDIPRKIFRLVL